MADDDWYKPNPKPTPPRQLKPGKHVWTLVKAGRRFDCELRFQGESYGWECQLLEDGEIRFGWRFPLHQAQPPKPKCSAGIPAGRLEGSGDEPSSGLRAVKRGKGDEYRLGKGVHHRPARRGRGVSGAKDRRAALDRLLADARRRRFDVVVVWRLDRLGRNLRHLIVLLEELQALGIAFVSLGEGIDATTPAGNSRCTSWARLRNLSARGLRSG